MNKYQIKFSDKFEYSPLSYWVHIPVNCNVWIQAKQYEPPLPKPIPCKGYPYLVVNALGVELRFSSVAEAEHFLEVMSQKNLPTTYYLRNKRGSTYGPNGHWLSRLPARLKPWVKRQKYLPIIEKGIAVFNEEYS